VVQLFTITAYGRNKMAKQTINTSTPNSGKGDSLFAAFTKINANFSELYDGLAGIEIGEVSWDSITGKPTIPTDISQLTDNLGLLADSFDGGAAATVFDVDAVLDGGTASTVFDNKLTIDGGGA